MSLGIVIDHNLQRAKHGHDTRSALVQILADEVLQHGQFERAAGLRNSDGGAEIADRFRCVAATANTGEGRHARIVPAADQFLLHQFQQSALAEQRVSKAEPIELVLLGRKDAQILDEPVVKRPVVLKFERAHRVRDMLDRIRLAVRVVVHRIDAPPAAGAVMVCVQDPVHHRVAHIEIGRGHVDFGAQHTRAVGELALAHALEQVKILVDRTVAIGAFCARLGQRAAMPADFLRA